MLLHGETGPPLRKVLYFNDPSHIMYVMDFLRQNNGVYAYGTFYHRDSDPAAPASIQSEDILVIPWQTESHTDRQEWFW